MINEGMAVHQQVHLRGIHYLTGEYISLTITDGMISECRVIGPAPEGGAVHGSTQDEGPAFPYIAPGLVDLQINGYAGTDLNTHPLSEENVLRLSERLWAEGVTSFYPTLITNSDEALHSGMRAIASVCSKLEDSIHPAFGTVSHNITGIHLEGPFISREDGPRGAHDAAYVKPPDWELFQSWQEAAGGRIRLVTMSPEWPDSAAFIERCTQSGVIVSIGHTAATSSQIREAAAAGARLSTHLGNGAHPVLPRHPNYIWDQLDEERLWASVIADGFHLPDSVLSVFAKVKRDRLILVSDAVSFSGMQPGTYDTHIGGRVTLTAKGRLHLADQPALLAGSALPMTAGIAHLANAGICSLGGAWELASTGPSRLMGRPEQQGLRPGAPADVVVFTQEEASIRILQTYKQGQMKYQAPRG